MGWFSAAAERLLDDGDKEKCQRRDPDGHAGVVLVHTEQRYSGAGVFREQRVDLASRLPHALFHTHLDHLFHLLFGLEGG